MKEILEASENLEKTQSDSGEKINYRRLKILKIKRILI